MAAHQNELELDQSWQIQIQTWVSKTLEFRVVLQIWGFVSCPSLEQTNQGDEKRSSKHWPRMISAVNVGRKEASGRSEGEKTSQMNHTVNVLNWRKMFILNQFILNVHKKEIINSFLCNELTWTSATPLNKWERKWLAYTKKNLINPDPIHAQKYSLGPRAPALSNLEIN